MNTRRRNRLYAAVAILLASPGHRAGDVCAALKHQSVLYPGEILYGKGEAHEKPEAGQRLRVGGMVMPGSVRRDPNTLAVSFKLYDARGVVSVSFEGILPDSFREGQGVVAQGVLAAGNEVIAKEVLAKHDEKYTPPEIEDAMKSNHTGPQSLYQAGNKSS